MNKFNKRLGGLKSLLHLLNNKKSSSSSLARLYSISFSIVKGSPLSVFNQETGSYQETPIFSVQRNNTAKPTEVATKQTINLTKYGSHHEHNKIKGIKPIPIQTRKENIESSNAFIASSARILLNNRKFEDVINLIKSSCPKDENGDLDIKTIASQEAGTEVLLKLHQAYAAMKNLEEMKKIIQHITNPLMYNKFQGEIIKHHAATDNHVEALKLLGNMAYIPYWNLIFLGVTKLVVYRIPESTHEIITFLNQYIENHKHEINNTISEPSQHLKDLPANYSIKDVIIRIRKFFDGTGYELDRVRFALMTIEALSLLEDFGTMEILFNILIDKNENNADVLSKLKGIMMHSLISLGRYEDALSVFFDIKTPPNIRTYEKLMHVYIGIGHYDFAIYLCETYVKNPTTEIYVLLIKAHILKGNIEKAEYILRDVIENSKLTDDSQIVMKTLLMSAYAEAGMIQQVQKLFDSIEKPDARCYNELMKAYCHIGDTKRVKEIFQSVPSKDAVSFLYLLDGLAIDGDSSTALKFYNLIPNPNHIHADAVVRALLADTKSGLDGALNFFNKLRNPSILTRKRILGAISKAGDLENALSFFKTIPNPDTECFGLLLRTFFYTQERYLSRAEEFFSRIPNPDAQCYASMISIYGRSGRLDLAEKMLHQYPSPSTLIAFFYAYFSNNPKESFWEKYETLEKLYPRCFDKPVYLASIKEAVKYKKKKQSIALFRIYLQKVQNKQTRDLLGLLLFIAKESSYRENETLTKEIIDAVPNCIATPNTLGQIKEIAFEIEQLI
ncbi:predicted protein [Naegleria gruberi]|uniref:Predicted protein n=1 Tax=Naegleria gruberi TaxID=5762 RepID=D2VSD2_NAEGR|nr:uncharacterized protein NAEGRDRAFT_71899 [Naegleria gruberi]EFC40326.1 predicted protein [Naegleria gruberi]|eukprot:XP_002673070.1 predicted protein [Naegleria gruberi strain NEG-M]